jgi:hypothetical protein
MLPPEHNVGDFLATVFAGAICALIALVGALGGIALLTTLVIFLISEPLL